MKTAIVLAAVALVGYGIYRVTRPAESSPEASNAAGEGVTTGDPRLLSGSMGPSTGASQLTGPSGTGGLFATFEASAASLVHSISVATLGKR